MIELSAEAKESVFFKMLAPEFCPTHAHCVGQNVSNAGGGLLIATYWLGRLDDAGAFVVSDFVPGETIQIPTAREPIPVGDDFKPSNETPAITRDDMEKMLANLLGEGVVPSADDPRVPMQIPGKRLNDWQVRDIDAIAAFVSPRLRGSVV